MIIPKISQVPIRQPMYVNGVMHQVWIDFFEKLAALTNTDDYIDLIELAQKAAELPSQATQGQQGFAISDLQNQFQQSFLPQIETLNTFDLVPICCIQNEESPPLQAVFLCPEPYIQLAQVTSGAIIHD
ncbi:hypothetical protein [Acinetobacter sp. Ac_5812]|uniref:hypothetical protein n=1 Tax=Acinetobacter sp. Ac_5812 TaxID=1848937 RepID=UPI00148FBA23|nr:hypothetical protein [Acinetobacter sp. Ac_5812]NNP70932.1 hypothetical protein [Acinetobacter sp. Ac_5812]